MLGRNVKKTINSHNFNLLFKPIKNIIKNSPIIANLESPLTLSKEESLIKTNSPIFSGNPKIAKQLSKNNFVALSLANNHIFDHGKSGFINTKNILEKFNIKCFGAGLNLKEATEPARVKIDDFQVSFFGASYRPIAKNKNPGVNYLYSDILIKKIKKEKKLKKKNIIIVFLHTGIEMLDFPLPRDEKVSKNIINAGADLVIGGHPHCIQVKEKYKKKLIYYSLGDLIFDHNNKAIKEKFKIIRQNTSLHSDKILRQKNLYSLILKIIIDDNKIKKIEEYIVKIPEKSEEFIGKPLNGKRKKEWFKIFLKMNMSFKNNVNLKKKLKDIEKKLLKRLQKG